ncbi:MAG: hypothetical protein SGILL_001144, partial [Bacillariaceae sp.]
MMRLFASFNSAESYTSETSSLSTPVKSNCERGIHSDDEKGIDNSTPSKKSKEDDNEAFTNDTNDENNGQNPAADPAMAIDLGKLVSPMKPSTSLESLVELVNPEEMNGDIEQGNWTPLEALKNLQPSHRLVVHGKQKHHHRHLHHSKSSIKRHNNHAVHRPTLWKGTEINEEEESTAHVLMGMASKKETQKYTSNLLLTGNGHRNGDMHNSVFQDFNVHAIPGLPPPPPALPLITGKKNGKKGGSHPNGGKTTLSTGPDNLWKKNEEVGFVQSKPYKKVSKKKKQPSPPHSFIL